MKKVSLLLAILLMSFPALVQAGKPLATVSGGGIASFDLFEGLESQFAIGATIRSDGTSKGRFVCMIVGMVAISGDITDGALNADGSVTFSGVANGIDLVPDFFGPFKGCEFGVTLWPGGPGVGRFEYCDCVVPCEEPDAETVESGQIMINVH